MRLLDCLRQLGLSVGLALGWFLLLIGLVAVVYPDVDAGPVDTCVANAPLALTPPSVVLYEIDRLARPARHRMVLLGSSNTMLALRPDDVRRHLPKFEVANLAIPTSNVYQALQVATLATSVSDAKTLKNTVFVLGAYPGLFAKSSSLWRGRRSPLTSEMLRYGLYHDGNGDTPEPVLGHGLAGVTKVVYRTLLGADVFAKATGKNASRIGNARAFDFGLFRGSTRNLCRYKHGPPGETARQKHIKKRARQIGTSSRLQQEQFVVLEKLVQTVRQSGARLIVVELPVPTWMRRDHFDFYRERKQDLVRRLTRKPRVDYVDLYDALPDELMGDSTHVLRDGAREYARAFAAALRALPEPIR